MLINEITFVSTPPPMPSSTKSGVSPTGRWGNCWRRSSPRSWRSNLRRVGLRTSSRCGIDLFDKLCQLRATVSGLLPRELSRAQVHVGVQQGQEGQGSRRPEVPGEFLMLWHVVRWRMPFWSQSSSISSWNYLSASRLVVFLFDFVEKIRLYLFLACKNHSFRDNILACQK